MVFSPTVWRGAPRVGGGGGPGRGKRCACSSRSLATVARKRWSPSRSSRSVCGIENRPPSVTIRAKTSCGSSPVALAISPISRFPSMASACRSSASGGMPWTRACVRDPPSSVEADGVDGVDGEGSFGSPPKVPPGVAPATSRLLKSLSCLDRTAAFSSPSHSRDRAIADDMQAPWCSCELHGGSGVRCHLLPCGFHPVSSANWTSSTVQVFTRTPPSASGSARALSSFSTRRRLRSVISIRGYRFTCTCEAEKRNRPKSSGALATRRA